jgi:hypothetical protein
LGFCQVKKLQLFGFENCEFTKLTKEHFVNYKDYNRTKNGVCNLLAPITIMINSGNSNQ